MPGTSGYYDARLGPRRVPWRVPGRPESRELALFQGMGLRLAERAGRWKPTHFPLKAAEQALFLVVATALLSLCIHVDMVY